MLITLVAAMIAAFAPRAVASPPPSPISYPGCMKIQQRDGVWIGSVCPEQIWSNGIPYPGFAVYYFGFLTDPGDYVRMHFRVDNGPERVMTMMKDTGIYYGFDDRNLFEARFIPYLPARSNIDLDLYFSRQVDIHDEYGQHFKINLRM